MDRDIVLTSPSLPNTIPTVSDVIGDDYKSWQLGDVIMITAPTGSGKSYFALHVLLEWTINNYLSTGEKARILYLVNRKILKLQLEDDLIHDIQRILDTYPDDLQYKDFISIKTYQAVEEKIKESPLSITDLDYKYVIYDECHYFLSDSTFNPSSILSYTFLTQTFDMSVQIFMSATIEDIRKFIKRKYDHDKHNAVNLFHPKDVKEYISPFRINHPWEIREYSIDADYSNIKLHAIANEKEIPYLLMDKEKGGGKWLIFVDSISYGENLTSYLKKELDLKDDIVFVDAEYERNEDAAKTVEEIATEKILPRRIAVCTCVLDNGVSLHDFGLRNLVIIADMKEELIQMLGRKRINEGEEIDVYLCKQDIEFFTRRLNEVKATRDTLNECAPLFKAALPPNRFFPTYVPSNKTVSYPHGFFPIYVPSNETAPSSKRFFPTYVPSNETAKTPHGVFPFYVPSTGTVSSPNNHPLKVLTEQPPVPLYHCQPSFFQPDNFHPPLQKLLSKIMRSESFYRRMKRFCFIFCCTFYISGFSRSRLASMESFYKEMQSGIANDPDLFLKKQAEWLRYDVKDIEIYTYEMTEEKKAENISKIKEVLEPYICREGPTKETQKELAKKLRKYVIPLLEAFDSDSWQIDIGKIKKGELAIDRFNSIMKCDYINLPYRMKGNKQSGTISIIIDETNG